MDQASTLDYYDDIRSMWSLVNYDLSCSLAPAQLSAGCTLQACTTCTWHCFVWKISCFPSHFLQAPPLAPPRLYHPPLSFNTSHFFATTVPRVATCRNRWRHSTLSHPPVATHLPVLVIFTGSISAGNYYETVQAIRSILGRYLRTQRQAIRFHTSAGFKAQLADWRGSRSLIGKRDFQTIINCLITHKLNNKFHECNTAHVNRSFYYNIVWI